MLAKNTTCGTSKQRGPKTIYWYRRPQAKIDLKLGLAEKIMLLHFKNISFHHKWSRFIAFASSYPIKRTAVSLLLTFANNWSFLFQKKKKMKKFFLCETFRDSIWQEEKKIREYLIVCVTSCYEIIYLGKCQNHELIEKVFSSEIELWQVNG